MFVLFCEFRRKREVLSDRCGCRSHDLHLTGGTAVGVFRTPVLNGIRLYVWDNNKPKLVAHKSFNSYFLSESAINYETQTIVKEHLKNSCKMLGFENATDAQLTEISRALVSETQKTTQLIGHGE